MKPIYGLLCATALISCSTKYQADIGPETPPSQTAESTEITNPTWPAPVKEPNMNNTPKYESLTLDNGLEVYAVHKSSVPMVTVLLAVKNGAYVETPDIDGLAHLYEHMFFKANDKLASQPEFIAALDQLGVELGSQMNAYTGTETVGYFFTIQSRFLQEGLQFMANAIRTPKFLLEEMEQERKVVAGEFDRFEASPTRVFYQFDMMQRLFGTYFSRKNVIGDREVIMNATPEQMRFIQQRFYIPNNTALFIVGDFEKEETFRWIKGSFGDWAPGNEPFEESPIPEHPALTETAYFEKEAAVQTTSIVRAYHGPSLTIDDPATIALDLAAIMLGLESSAYQKELVHSGLATSASFFPWSQRYTGSIFFTAEAAPGNEKEVYKKMDELIARISQGSFFTEQQFQIAKAAIETRSAYEREVGQRYAQGLSGIWTGTGSLDYYLNYIPNVRALSLSEVDRTFKQYVADSFYVAGALRPKSAPAVFEQTTQQKSELSQ